TFLPVASIPNPLDIAWCWFPVREAPESPGPKHRPTLVRAIKMSPDQTKAAIQVTFGTSNAKHGERPFDLLIENSTGLDHCGLPYVTRFDMDKTIWLPWAVEYFTPREGYSHPVPGSLNDLLKMQLEALKVAR